MGAQIKDKKSPEQIKLFGDGEWELVWIFCILYWNGWDGIQIEKQRKSAISLNNLFYTG